MKEIEIPIIIIQGPTAVGKSKLALDLANRLESEIISADSRQVYKYLDIGTAKPSMSEREQVKHWLIDVVPPDMNFSAGDFIEKATEIIHKMNKNNKIPIIVGGTGFYIKALLKGLFKSPEVPKNIREELMKESQEKGLEYLYERLEKIDPTSAKRIDSNDINRVIRALEIYEASGKTITKLWQENPPDKNALNPFNILLLDERQSIYSRINQRVDSMVANGLVEEVRHLLNKGYTPSDPGMNTVGYREFFPYINGDREQNRCIEKIKQHTRNYAKRQLTWYRKIDFDLTLKVKNVNVLEIIDKIEKWRNSRW